MKEFRNNIAGQSFDGGRSPRPWKKKKIQTKLKSIVHGAARLHRQGRDNTIERGARVTANLKSILTQYQTRHKNKARRPINVEHR